MVKILLVGCNGKMGRVISASVAERSDCKIAAGIDINTDTPCGYPVFAKVDACNVETDVIIDFSHPTVTMEMLEYAVASKLPMVVATTGLSDEQRAKVAEAGKKTAIFFTANMSLGVNLIAELCKRAAKLLGNDFDIEIVEKHHNQKIDAPSGTAIMLADAVSEALPHDAQYVYDRHSRRKKREKNEIGIHAIRGGTIVGEHDVIFAGRDEVVTISHCAYSKDIFATGSINAALFLVKQEAGLYNMGHLV